MCQQNYFCLCPLLTSETNQHKIQIVSLKRENTVIRSVTDEFLMYETGTVCWHWVCSAVQCWVYYVDVTGSRCRRLGRTVNSKCPLRSFIWSQLNTTTTEPLPASWSVHVNLVSAFPFASTFLSTQKPLICCFTYVSYYWREQKLHLLVKFECGARGNTVPFKCEHCVCKFRGKWVSETRCGRTRFTCSQRFSNLCIRKHK